MNRQPIIECVPNFSEGQNPEKIRAIVDAISDVRGLKVLHVDTGYSANRSVVSFAGNPDAVVEGAFQGIKKASELIDMRKHKGVHPRFGATDVCPLIPFSGLTMEQAIEYSCKLGRRVGEELNIPVYLYEKSATQTHRANLSEVRKGEFEGLPEKMNKPLWKPDYGPEKPHVSSGAIAIGARKFLVAYNINLATSDVAIAKQIAAKIRERGRALTDPSGDISNITGRLKHVKAIGWYIEEYKRVQVSTNITDADETPVHQVYETVKSEAAKLGIQLTGSEIVGLIPLKYLLEAGRHYSKLKEENVLITAAIKGLGLDDLYRFVPEKKILENVLERK